MDARIIVRNRTSKTLLLKDIIEKAHCTSGSKRSTFIQMIEETLEKE